MNEIKSYDISNLWTQEKIIIEDGDEIIDRPEPLGYIGENYYRFYIHFISAIQNKDNSFQYFIYGKTKLKTNICSFQGTVTIVDSRVYKVPDAPGFKQGFIIGEYEFYEDNKQNGSGKLYGKCICNFIIDKSNNLRYDALMAVADGFSNNEFSGFWQSYTSKDIKKCNWGDFRIPDSRNLDGGAGEFVVSDKYVHNGWDNYVTAYQCTNPDAEKARKIEEQAWWK